MKTRAFIAFITLASFILRLIQSRAGYNPIIDDEWVLQRASLQMMATGGLNDLFLGYGDVLKIPYLFLDIVYYLVGVWKGAFNQVSTLLPYEGFASFNRWINVLTGTLAIPVVYAIGNKLYNRIIGIVLALFLFVNPLQFSYSLYGKPDNTAFFFLLLSLFFALDIGSEDKKTNRNGYLLSGLFLAFSIGTKVNFFLGALFPLLMHLFSPRENLIKKFFSPNLLLFFAALAGCYLLITPTMWLSFPFYWSFWLAFFFENSGPEISFVFSQEKMVKLQDFLIRVMGSPLIFYAACLGLAGMAAGRRKRVLALSGIVILIYLSSFISAKNVYYFDDPHPLFPLLPFLLVFAGSGVNLLCAWLKLIKNNTWYGVSAVSLTVFLIFSPLTHYIVNAEPSFIYLGGNNKASFTRYMKTGKTDAQPNPLNLLPVKTREVITAAMESGGPEKTGFVLAGKRDKKIIAFPFKSGLKSQLNFQVQIGSRSDLLRSSVLVKVMPVKIVNGRYFPLHENAYTLFSSGIKNWRETDISLENEIRLNQFDPISVDILNHLEKDGIESEAIACYLVTFELDSPFETVDCEFKEITLL